MTPTDEERLRDWNERLRQWTLAQRQAEMRAQAADARQRAIGWAVAGAIGALFWAWVLGFFA